MWKFIELLAKQMLSSMYINAQLNEIKSISSFNKYCYSILKYLNDNDCILLSICICN